MSSDETKAAAPEAAATRTGRIGRTWLRNLSWWQEGVLLLALALIVALVVKSFFFQTYAVNGSSMEPGLTDGDRMVVKKFGGPPERGDVVVFDDPGGWLAAGQATDGHLVKRVIGVPGDVITCCSAGKLLVNGKPLAEDYLLPQDGTSPCAGPMISTCEWSAGPVPEGKLFVMGDNRANSDDSTVHLCQPNETDCTRDPYVDFDEVVGTVVAVAWPPSAWGKTERPAIYADVPDPK